MHWLKRNRNWLLIAVVVASPLFFIGGPDWLSAPVIREAWEQGHWVFFACLLFWVQGRWPLQAPRQWLLATLLVLVLSAVIEGLQTLVGRQASVHDVMLNLFGTWVGLFWGQRARLSVWAGRVLATAAVLWQFSTVMHLAIAQWVQWHNFPVLADFESRWEMVFWSGEVQRVRAPVIEGQRSLAVQLLSTPSDPYAGAGLNYMVDDWRGYQAIHLSIYNPGDDNLALTLRLNDATHDRTEGLFSDRYNGRLMAEPGWNHYRIPLADVANAPETRAMNLARMIRLLIFAAGVTEPRWIYLDNLRLEKE